MHRAYTVLLVALFALAATPVAAAPPPATPAVDEPVAAPINDAGLWLTVGGATFTAASAAVAFVLDGQLKDPQPYAERAPTRVAGLSFALLAIMGAATTGTGLVFLFWPAE